MPSVGKLEAHQKPTDRPLSRIKRSGGQSLVNRGLATWITRNVLLKMLQPREINELAGLQVIEIRAEEFFDYDYPANEFPARKFWRQNLLIHYPLRDQGSY